MMPDFDSYFESYSALYNRALTDISAYKDIMTRFSDCFIAAGPDGVKCGENDEAFRKQLEGGAAFHRQIGTKRMTKVRCDVAEIDATHHMVKVSYHADYEKDGRKVGLDFDVTYMLDSGKGEPRIFAFVAGDEMEAYRKAGLVD
jgi:hypothetical protein